MMRDCGRRCVYCAAPLDIDIATIDHVLPLAKGGVHSPGNLVAACGRCNRLKGDLLPTEFFARYPWAGLNFIHYARAVHRALKRCARRAVSLAYARAAYRCEPPESLVRNAVGADRRLLACRARRPVGARLRHYRDW